MIGLTVPLTIEVTQADVAATRDDPGKRRLDVWLHLYTSDDARYGKPVLLSLADYGGDASDLSYRLVLDQDGHPGVEPVELELGYSDGLIAYHGGRMLAYLKDEGMI